MKTIFRLSGLGLLLAAIAGGSAVVASAQDPCADADGQTALYTKFTDLYSKTSLADRKETVNVAKQFLEKYGACEAVQEQAVYLKGAIPKFEEIIAKMEKDAKMRTMFQRFDAAINSDNNDELYAAGRDILADQPDNINIIVPMAVAGYYNSSSANNFKYADEGIRYANLALNKIKSGAKFTKKNAKGEETVGALKYEYTRPNVINELNFTVAYLTYFGKKDKKAAIPMFYELSQNGGVYRDDPRVYGAIGDYYIEQGAPLGEQIAALIKKQTENKDESEEVKDAREVEIKKLVALFNGYTERALDAYTRAHKVARSDTPAAKAYKDNLYKMIQSLYKRRFEKETGLDAYIATTLARPMPNPASEVMPVEDPEPTTTTTTTGTAVVKPLPVAEAPAPKPAETVVASASPKVKPVVKKAAPAKRKPRS
jgi:hypothetical protein